MGKLGAIVQVSDIFDFDKYVLTFNLVSLVTFSIAFSFQKIEL